VTRSQADNPYYIQACDACGHDESHHRNDIGGKCGEVVMVVFDDGQRGKRRCSCKQYVPGYAREMKKPAIKKPRPWEELRKEALELRKAMR
jgi:hypothetical protein